MHRVPPEKRDHRFQQLRPPSHDVSVQMLSVVVIPPITEYLSDLKEVAKLIETRDALSTLRHGKLVSDLVAGPVAFPCSTARLPNEPDGEAPFSVYKTNNPATQLDQPFLLIVRTRHVVTMVNVRSDGTMSSAGYSEFPAYSQMRTVLLPARGAAIYLRTVIVTAAVYRGLDSKLCPKANLSS